mmetsp:Transcript_91194/g.174936  ORF Transcript_91194/g.174936 Transcript_91194/m.174936 type:complete len:208 (+) Transcript_91194:265-888(+)
MVSCLVAPRNHSAQLGLPSLFGKCRRISFLLPQCPCKRHKLHRAFGPEQVDQELLGARVIGERSIGCRRRRCLTSCRRLRCLRGCCRRCLRGRRRPLWSSCGLLLGGCHRAGATLLIGLPESCGVAEYACCLIRCRASCTMSLGSGFAFTRLTSCTMPLPRTLVLLVSCGLDSGWYGADQAFPELFSIIIMISIISLSIISRCRSAK